jgi:hypothetical protein
MERKKIKKPKLCCPLKGKAELPQNPLNLLLLLMPHLYITLRFLCQDKLLEVKVRVKTLLRAFVYLFIETGSCYELT